MSDQKLAGRRDLFQQHSGEADFLQRFDKLMDDVQSRRTPLKVAADALRVHPRTLERAIEKRKQQRAAAVTYERVDKWQDMPDAVSFESWVTAKHTKNSYTIGAGKTIVSAVQRIWTEAWHKKNIALLTDQDIITALEWIRNLSLSKGGKRTYLMAIRAMIRSGVGQHKWLAGLLDTRGSKGAPRIPPELRAKETFVQVMPRLFTALLKLKADGGISPDEFDEMDLIVTCKSTLGIRTGDRAMQRELWGTVINNPSTTGSSLLIDRSDGHVVHWTTFCKKDETWELSRTALDTYANLGLVEKLENFVRRHDLKNGDFLIKMDMARAREILDQMCRIAELSHYTMHDLRKVAATRAILAGVHLETVAEMGVGWKDVATLKEFYVTIKGIHADEGYALVKAYLNNGGREVQVSQQ